MTRIHVRVIIVSATVLLACLPTEPCACPPAPSLFTLFGSVQGPDEQPAPGATIRTSAFRDTTCAGGEPDILTPNTVQSAASGAFRINLRSVYSPGPRCLRIVAFAGEPTVTDSVVVPPLVVHFRVGRDPPDSLGILVRLP